MILVVHSSEKANTVTEHILLSILLLHSALSCHGTEVLPGTAGLGTAVDGLAYGVPQHNI